ncbi:LPS O-antigen chain length determinant protein WzzB [Kosakonia sp. BK9b]
MTHEKNNTAVRRDDDSEGIDLFDVILQIWRGKWIVVIFIALALAIAVAYLSTAKHKWTSTAVITMPDAGQIADYATAFSTVSNDPTLKMLDIRQQVIERYGSAFMIFAQNLAKQNAGGELSIDNQVSGQTLPLKVNYRASSPDEAQQKLTEYIHEVDARTSKELNEELLPSIQARLRELQAGMDTQEKVAQEQKALRLQQITQALTIARDANVTAPQITQAQNVSQDTLFLLGSAALESMIKNAASRPLALSEDYYKFRQEYLDVQSLKSDPASMHTYRYVMEPDLPVQRDGPKRSLVLIIAVLLGAMLGAAFVLARHAIRSYTRRA